MPHLMAILAACLLGAAPPDDASAPRITVLIVVGVPGTAEYAAAHATAVQQWRDAATKAGADFLTIGVDSATATPSAKTDHDQLRDTLARLATPDPSQSPAPLWVVLLGHGSFDGRVARFNLRGPDLADAELADWLKPIRGPVALLDCTSASAPFLSKLAAPNRVVVSATKSGAEQNYARFGQYLAQVWTDPTTDLDKDGQTSLLEGYLVAARRTADFYKSKARLSTEHALIDDNADGRGTPADWFEGVRLVHKPKDGVADGQNAHQLHLVRAEGDRHATPEQLRRRGELEAQIRRLQDQKDSAPEADYYKQLEPVMVELAQTYADPDPTAAKKP